MSKRNKTNRAQERYPRRLQLVIIILLFSLWCSKAVKAQEPPGYFEHFVLPGDTWSALAWRYDIPVTALRSLNPSLNLQRQPAIGSYLRIPGAADNQRMGQLFYSNAGSLLEISARQQLNPWTLVSTNHLISPYRPQFYHPLFIPGGADPPRLYPPGFNSLELSHVPALPGQGIALRALLPEGEPVNINYAGIPMAIFVNGRRLVGLVGTGAFFPSGDHELTVDRAGQPSWTQPWRMVNSEWTFEQINYTGSAAAITQEEIQAERQRLFEIWKQQSPNPLWQAPFLLPIKDYLEISSYYGARRSYNGSPYSSYHEGTDFSAYAGTPVFAPAAGLVVVAEQLKVRGGAVIIDHGLGVYSGVYHLSEVLARPDQIVTQGELIGRVGTSGLSTGNHLHWDLLVGATWINGLAWFDSPISCWILQAWDESCDVVQANEPVN